MRDPQFNLGEEEMADGGTPWCIVLAQKRPEKAIGVVTLLIPQVTRVPKNTHGPKSWKAS